MVEAHRIGSQRCLYFLYQHHLQAATMHSHLRPAVPCLQATRFVPDQTAISHAISQIGDGHTEMDQLIQQSEFGHLAHRMGQHIDAHTQWLRDAHRFIDHRFEAHLGQTQCSSQTNDAATHNGNTQRRITHDR